MYSINDKPLYIVATPRGDALKEIQSLQKFLARKFRMYRPPYPVLHATVGIIEDTGEGFQRLFPALEQIAKSYLPLTVHIDGNRCFDSPYLSVGLSVTSEKLARMAGEMEGALISAGAKPRSFARWQFHINLINPLYAYRKWSRKEFRKACAIAAARAPETDCTLERLEIWHPDFPPLKVLAQFKP